MTETKKIPFEALEFTVGKIAPVPGKAVLFVLDSSRLELLQLSSTPDYKVMNRLSLKESIAVQQVDTLFVAPPGTLIIADSISQKLFKIDISWDDNDLAVLGNAEEIPLAAGSVVAAACIVGEEYWLLDKGNSMIRIYNKQLVELRTLGSRMGYISEFARELDQRLGFEFPEDMALSPDGEQLVVSDSGNKRLVVLKKQTGGSSETGQLQWKQHRVIRLPHFPFKIIAWDRDRILVSDFDCSLMTVSPAYGFVALEEIDRSVDFFPSSYMYGVSLNRVGVSPKPPVLVGSETGGLIALTLPDVALAEVAETASNWEVLLKIRIDSAGSDRNRSDGDPGAGSPDAGARALVAAHPQLMPMYMAYHEGGDSEFDEPLSAYVRETFTRVMVENADMDIEVMDLARQYIAAYKAIPDADDQEAVHIEKENLRHDIFLKLKDYRRRLYELDGLSQAVRYSTPASAVLETKRQERLQVLKKQIDTCAAEVEEHLAQYDELKLLDAIVCYWLRVEEAEVVFPRRNLGKHRLFNGNFLLAILQNFYSNVAALYHKRGRIDEYISFCDREITMFPDKLGVFRQFCTTLISLGKYDDVMRMLQKFPDSNKENVNYLYYRVYKARGDRATAFQHLKKELELYPHRIELIPQLIALQQLTEEESQNYIDKILDKSGHAIDTYLNAANAFYNIGHHEQAEHYVDRELELFPENKNALSLKISLFCRHPQGSMGEGYYRNIWRFFKSYIRLNRGDAIASSIMEFFSVLNHFTPDEMELQELAALKDAVSFGPYKKELQLYLSFRHHCPVADKAGISIPDPGIKPYEPQDYLAGLATGRLAYDYYFDRVKRLAAGEPPPWDDIFQRVEAILKYNPGDPEIFAFLDRYQSDISLPGGAVVG